MPEGELADGFTAAARSSIEDVSQPRDAKLGRAVGSCYHAVFHAPAAVCADCLVGPDATSRPRRARAEVCRALNHGTSKDGCESAKNVAFPDEIKGFARSSRCLQEARHLCDHDPVVRITEPQAAFHLTLAEESIQALRAAREKDRLAFATWTSISSRSKGVRDARARAKLADPSRIDPG